MMSLAKPLIFGIFAAALSHGTIILMSPYWRMDTAMKRISRDGEFINRWVHPGRVSETSRKVVRPSPDIVYSSCVYDLKTGPVQVIVHSWQGYLSVSAYADNSDNYYTVNDQQVPGDIEFWIVRRALDAPKDAKNVIQSPSRKGIILQRRLANTAQRYAEADLSRKNDICATRTSR